MAPKSGRRFSDKAMRLCEIMAPKSGRRFSDKAMRQPDRCVLPGGTR
jgi:hypothetical protein